MQFWRRADSRTDCAGVSVAQSNVHETNLLPQASTITDPLLSNQWYLNNTNNPGYDINVLPVWDDYRGSGISIAILDDGFDYNHPDLAANYDRSRDYIARLRR